MYIIMVASECAPVSKVGGLADVIYGLSRELEVRGNEVEIILPKYDCMRYDHIFGLELAYQDLWVPWGANAIHCSVWFGFVNGRKCFFIDPHSDENFFNRDNYYGYPDDAIRFAFFSKATLEFMLKINKRPDIIHCHDWQTGLVPVLLFEMYKPQGMHHPRVCYTVHNFRYQGITGTNILSLTHLNQLDYYQHNDRLQDNVHFTALNFMKGGIVYSNFVTTVSPKHAWEAQHTEQGQGLGETLHIHKDKFGGILNGLDYEVWNPEIDPLIPHHYTIETLDNKYGNKKALRDRLLLREEYKPLIAYVGRLDVQKGVHLIQNALFYSLQNGAQFVLLGSSPEESINKEFLRIKQELNDNEDCHLEIGFNEELAHLIYAGADMIIMPSMYEPCGLAQMIALRYGTVPIVRAVGGLIDTIFDRDHSSKAITAHNGYVFQEADHIALNSAMSRAIGLWYGYPNEFRKLVIQGMQYNYSWQQSGQHYFNIYELIRNK
ncbi:glycogen synthase [Candidatus Parabeggiatoa sp. HSG14]|uniref:glycogen synthase n=1 Tax=Candidatus Parabeggiatoa sp. HSG14 TaxID=3055593 RepID=UPI0025A90071|nr:glycogen synthase [Thiotrichales bacterium HSG14]